MRLNSILFATGLLFSSFGLHATDPAPTAASKQKMFTALAIGGGLSYLAGTLGHEILPSLAAKTAMVSSALLSAGVAVSKPELKDLAYRVPALVLTSTLAGSEYAQELWKNLPLGIGKALEDAGSDITKLLATVALYTHVVTPAVTHLLYNTQYGKFAMDL